MSSTAVRLLSAASTSSVTCDLSRADASLCVPHHCRGGLSDGPPGGSAAGAAGGGAADGGRGRQAAGDRGHIHAGDGGGNGGADLRGDGVRGGVERHRV